MLSTMLWRCGCGWLLMLSVMALAGEPTEGPRPRSLEYLEKQFQATEQPVRFDYAVAYRFLNVQLKSLGTLTLRTTVGVWKGRGSTNETPAVFVDLAFNSGPRAGPGDRPRVSIHDRIVAVIGLPGMDAFLFAKDTDEYLNPLIGRTRILRSVSCYDVEGGALDYWHYDLAAGSVVTNLSNPQAIVDLSRQLRPILEFLMNECRAQRGVTLSPETLAISINAGGRVVPLRLKTVTEGSPWPAGGARLKALRVDVVPGTRSDARLYRFRGWAMPFPDLADHLNDDTLRRISREAFVKAVVPVAAEYELSLGTIRMTLLEAGEVSKPASAM